MRTSHMLCIFDLVRLLLYARLLDALSRAFSWAWRLWRSAGWCCGLPVRAFRSLFGARVPVLRSGAAGGGAAPGRLDAGRRRRLADYGARSLVSSVDCRCSCTGPVPANPGRRVHASYLTHAGGAGIELSSVYRYHRLHATGDKRNTRHETPFHTREPFRNRCT